jgi:hypothetical protein
MTKSNPFEPKVKMKIQIINRDREDEDEEFQKTRKRVKGKVYHDYLESLFIVVAR